MAADLATDEDERLVSAFETVVRRHLGSHDPVTSRELAEVFGTDRLDSTPRTRHILREVLRTRRIPVGASARGYFLIRTPEELDAYLGNLNLRIAGIAERVALTRLAFGEFYEGRLPVQQKLDVGFSPTLTPSEGDLGEEDEVEEPVAEIPPDAGLPPGTRWDRPSQTVTVDVVYRVPPRRRAVKVVGRRYGLLSRLRAWARARLSTED